MFHECRLRRVLILIMAAYYITSFKSYEMLRVFRGFLHAIPLMKLQYWLMDSKVAF